VCECLCAIVSAHMAVGRYGCACACIFLAFAYVVIVVSVYNVNVCVCACAHACVCACLLMCMCTRGHARTCVSLCVPVYVAVFNIDA